MKKIFAISAFVLAVVSANAQSGKNANAPSLINAAPVIVSDSSKAAAKNTHAKPELKEIDSSTKKIDNSKSDKLQKPVLDNASTTKSKK
ncbi:MAG: hypothetical protein HY841_04090 [Bacteroidetes bacterium]|nr:hypothetical protein [Bacteroidota bacterium]